MSSDLEIIIAFVFRRSGRPALRESEIYLPLSMELNWFSLEDAQRIVDAAISAHLLEKREGFLEPVFDIDEVEIPVGFSPSGSVDDLMGASDEKSTQLNDRLLAHLAKVTGKNTSQLVEQIEQVCSEKNVLFLVGAVIVSKKYNVDVSEFFEEIEKDLLGS